MPKLGLGAGIGRAIVHTPGIVTDNLVMKHMYPAGGVQPLSDGAAYLNGTDAYVDLGSKATSGDDATVSAWIYLLDANPNDILAYGDLMVRMQNATTLYVYPDKGSGAGYCTVPNSLNSWNHICIVIDDDAVALYHNGVLIPTTGTPGTLSTDSTASYIGRYGSDYFNGYICNVGFWTRTLDIAEVKSIMWKQYADLTGDASTGELKNLLSWWNLDTNAKDGTATNNGTLT
jgi:hypothetical protein